MLNDIHLQFDYKPGAKVHCGLPGGCCSDVSKGPDINPNNWAGYWATPDAFCDIPVHFFVNTVEFIRTNIEKPNAIFMLGDNGDHSFFNKSELLN